MNNVLNESETVCPLPFSFMQTSKPSTTSVYIETIVVFQTVLDISLYSAMGVYAGVSLIGALFSILLPVETAGTSLRQVTSDILS